MRQTDKLQGECASLRHEQAQVLQELDKLRSENGALQEQIVALIGHQNHKQKLHHTMKIKQEGAPSHTGTCPNAPHPSAAHHITTRFNPVPC